MKNADELVGNPDHDPSVYCFAKPDQVYLVYQPNGGESKLDLSDAKNSFTVAWFNPRDGGDLQDGNVTTVDGGGSVSLGTPPQDAKEDWLVVLKKKS